MASVLLPVVVAFFAEAAWADGQFGQHECGSGHQCGDSEHSEDAVDSSLLQASVDRRIAGGWPRPPPFAKGYGAKEIPAKEIPDQKDKAKSVKAKENNIKKHTIQIDDQTDIQVPRHQMEGVVREVTIKYSLQDNPIQVNGKTAYIPFSDMLEGEFSRNANNQDQQDYGVEKAMAFIGYPDSMISDRVKLAFAEKSHTFWFPGDVPHATKDRLDAERAAQSAEEAAQAIATRKEKLTALAGSAGTSGPEITMAGKDLGHVKAVREFVDSNMGDLMLVDWVAVKRAESELRSRRSQVTAESSIRSSIGCLHFENADLMNFTANGVEVPLARKLVVYRGRLAQFPNEEYQMSTGFAVFYHNNVSDSLDIYFSFSSVVDVVDSAAGFTSRFSIGPPDGQSLPVVPEGREASSTPEPNLAASALGNMLKSSSSNMPSDFTLLHSDRQDVGCTDSVLSTLAARSVDLQLLLRMGDNPKPGEILAMIPRVTKAYETGIDWALCAVNYLRPVYNDSAVVLSTLATLGFLHVLAELHPENVVYMVQDSTEWNTIHRQIG